jgi:hypothetical protein
MSLELITQASSLGPIQRQQDIQRKAGLGGIGLLKIVEIGP